MTSDDHTVSEQHVSGLSDTMAELTVERGKPVTAVRTHFVFEASLCAAAGRIRRAPGGHEGREPLMHAFVTFNLYVGDGGARDGMSACRLWRAR
eukprot:1134669-Prymnesium_polylepis.1